MTETNPNEAASSDELQVLKAEPDAIAPTETEYLDLDGDGVVDAVRTTSVTGYDVTGDGEIDVVETVEELAERIDVTGTPGHVLVTDTVDADFDHDGAAEIIESVELDIEQPPEST
jgi:hypothetical protein